MVQKARKARRGQEERARRSRKTKASASPKTRCVEIRMMVEEEYVSFVNVPLDVTEDELEEIARKLRQSGCFWDGEPGVYWQHDVEEVEEEDLAGCTAVRTEKGIKIVAESQG